MRVRVCLYRAGNGEWSYRVRNAGNGKIVLTPAETYKRRAYARSIAGRLFPGAAIVVEDD